jgi:hypothetical protein
MAAIFRAPLIDDRNRRPKRHDVSLYRPAPGAQPPFHLPVLPFRTLDPLDPFDRVRVPPPTLESLAVVSYQPPDNVTATLSGQSAAFAPGAFGVQNSQAVPGAASTFIAGSLLNESTIILLGGDAATFAAGALGPAISPVLGGNSAAFAYGYLAAFVNGGVSLTLSGQLATFTAGALGLESATTVGGQAAVFRVGSVSAQASESLSVNLVGESAAFAAGEIVSATWLNVLGEDAAFASGSLGVGAVFGWATVVALSQTGVQGAETAYPAGTFCFVVGSWYDMMGAPFVPSAVQYRVDDVLSGTNIVPWTPLTPSTSNQVTITSAQNAMISMTRPSEQHQVLFQITDFYGNTSYADVVYSIVRTPGA